MSAPLFAMDTVMKANTASWLYQKLTDAGWTMISSDPSVDDYVFHSTGESGDMDLYLCLNADAFSSTTNRYYMDVFPCLSYTPGADGTAGSFVAKNSTDYEHYWGEANTIGYLDSLINIYYNINKDRAIFVSVPILFNSSNTSLGHLCKSHMIYLGLPTKESVSSTTSKVNGGNFIWAYFAGTSFHNGAVYNAVYFFTPPIASTRIGLGLVTGQFWYTNNIPYVAGGKVPMIQMAVTDGTMDYGILDGIYQPPTNLSLLDGDIINVGEERYRVCWIRSTYGNTTPLCIRV